MALPEKDIALIRRFCFHTKEIRRIRAQFSNQKKKLNKAQRALQSQVKDILAGSPDTAVAIGPNSFLVMATCYTTRPITLEMVRSALEHVHTQQSVQEEWVDLLRENTVFEERRLFGGGQRLDQF